MDEFDKELEKLKDLEFDLNVARLSRQDEDIIKLAKAKYRMQYNKVLKLQETRSKEQNK